MPKKSTQPLENERHEQFARCLARGNLPPVCYYGVGFTRNPDAAVELANSPAIRQRSEEIFSQIKPFQYRDYGYIHITDK